MVTINCCYECDKRYPACHDSCEVYIAAKQKHEEKKAQIRKAKYHTDLVTGFTVDNVCKRTKKQRKMV